MRLFRKILANLLPHKIKSFNDSSSYWKNRYYFGGNSGKGSYGQEAEFKAQHLNNLIKKFNFDAIIELGCGDGNNAKYYDTNNYFGFDISSDAVEICKKKFKKRTNFNFFEIDENFPQKISDIKKSYNLQNELVISFDVMFHLIEDSIYEDYINKLENTSNKFMLIYSTDFDGNGTMSHVKHRAYSADLANKGWKELTDDTVVYSDKFMKLFKK